MMKVTVGFLFAAAVNLGFGLMKRKGD
ncbi:hypothetical protein MTBPR1_30324 [Candidatus Terasakiella magnetica]|uniref:Uncharacterized protein n=1 Tax=Candidatus Terasakiella magnetica TaxID=1867952 RepID=A0A1C3RIC2_9PROT|nr:hypothetical protein MTBPR1_30324 [Candidatus Terasakiella magnetica]